MGGVVGGIAGYMAGSKVGSAIYNGVKKVAKTAVGCVRKAWNGIKKIGTKIRDKVRGFFHSLFG